MDFLKRLASEDGSEAIEMACLMPLILLILAFTFDRFIIYEGTTSIAYAGNEAIRSTVIQSSEEEAAQRGLEILSDRLGASHMGWCDGPDLEACTSWDNGAIITSSVDSFKNNPQIRYAFATDKGWCSGSYITLSVRAHKASLIPSYSTLRKLLTEGGPVYHEYTYTVHARVESSKKCK